MDISIQTGSQKFNFRVCAMIISEGKILTLHGQQMPYYYLPGGRVCISETAEEAVLREVQEEIGISAKIIRPLWLNQAFFTDNATNTRYHELCIYYLMDISDTDLLTRGETFTVSEGERIHTFDWLEFDRLSELNFVPRFLKKDIYHLPAQFTIRTEIE